MQLLALPLPSLMHFSQLLRLYPVHSLQLSFSEDSSLLLLGKLLEDSGTIYYSWNQLLVKNSISNTQRTTPKVPAPQQGCSTAHRGFEGTNDSSSASSDSRSWCLSHDFGPVTKSTLCKTFLMKTSVLSHAYQVTLKLWSKFYYRNGVLATNSTSNI